MTRFDLSDLLRPPNLVSLLRIPLAIAFPFAAKRPHTALLVVATSALTDVLDGWLARRTGDTTPTGAIVDPIADKIFAISVVGTLLARHTLPAWSVPALFAREILEAPLMAWVLLHGKNSERDARANVPGKIATTIQSGALLWAISSQKANRPALVLAAVAGTAAGLSYWVRELRHEQTQPSEKPAV